jgi:hypothetical protein
VNGIALSIGIGAPASALLDPSGAEAAGKCRKTGEICRVHGDCCSQNCLPPDRAFRQRCGDPRPRVPEDGACKFTSECEAGLSCCENVCTDTSSDKFHCGVCGNFCATGNKICSGGECVCHDESEFCLNRCRDYCSREPTANATRFQACFNEDSSRKGDCDACAQWTGCLGALDTGVETCGVMNIPCPV